MIGSVSEIYVSNLYINLCDLLDRKHYFTLIAIKYFSISHCFIMFH